MVTRRIRMLVLLDRGFTPDAIDCMLADLNAERSYLPLSALLRTGVNPSVDLILIATAQPANAPDVLQVQSRATRPNQQLFVFNPADPRRGLQAVVPQAGFAAEIAPR